MLSIAVEKVGIMYEPRRRSLTDLEKTLLELTVLRSQDPSYIPPVSPWLAQLKLQDASLHIPTTSLCISWLDSVEHARFDSF